MRHLLTSLPLLLLLGCGGGDGQMTCTGHGVTVDRDFAGGAFTSCQFDAKGWLQLDIAPESEPINHSPWYAFRLTRESDASDQDSFMGVVLDYGDYEHRYQPDISRDGTNWQRLPEDSLLVNKDKKRVNLALPLAPGESVIVASQPLLTSASYAEWINKLIDQGKVKAEEIGQSPGGRTLWRLKTAMRPATLLVLGRQHPPETTGAQALIFFLERVLAEDDLARRFRAQVGLLVYPLINPDGVDLGHWRHNLGDKKAAKMGANQGNERVDNQGDNQAADRGNEQDGGKSSGMDLNRDWGIFSQPETRQVAIDITRQLNLAGTQLIKSMDFHSTWYEVFYTQEDGAASVQPQLLSAWLTDFTLAMQVQQPGFELNRQSSNNNRPTAKGYLFDHYGVASTTFEMGDATSTEDIEIYATTAAEAFMRAWLARPDNDEG